MTLFDWLFKQLSRFLIPTHLSFVQAHFAGLLFYVTKVWLHSVEIISLSPNLNKKDPWLITFF